VDPAEPPIVDRVFLPAVYRAASEASQRGQQTYLWIIRVQLVSLVIAAAFGVFSWNVGQADVAGIVAAVAFGVSLVGEVFQLREDPARAWYGGRAIAESAKTLSWRYMVGGQPFPLADPAEQAAHRFRARLGELLRDPPGSWIGAGDQRLGQATPEMTGIRRRPLAERQHIYLTERIQEQIGWYHTKALWNRRRARTWSLVLAVLTTVGLTAGVLKAAGIFHMDVLGLTAALVAAGGSWVQLKQHHNLVTAYSVAKHELALIAEEVTSYADEAEWADFVANAEEAISREHTLWRASR
jgi:hypothetical protein